MKAIIVAAGKGTRLGKYTKDLPKCMLKLNGISLLERQVRTLRQSGVECIVIIKGYMQEMITVPNVKYYVNEEYETTNMVESLMKARPEFDDEIIVSYADILYEERVVSSMIESKADISVCVDRDYWPYWQARLDKPEDDIESLVIDNCGKIIELGNSNCPPGSAKERYVGIIKFSREGLEWLKQVYDENKIKFYDSGQPWFNSPSFKKAYMTCMLMAIINSGFPVTAVPINRGWLEFDTVDDYERVVQWQKEGSIRRFFHLEY